MSQLKQAGKIVFILGGAKSGKTSFALKRASLLSGKKAYIATAQPLDKEMMSGSKGTGQSAGLCGTHMRNRLKISGVMQEIDGRYSAVVIDCLTLWISNLLHSGAEIPSESKALVSALKGIERPVRDIYYFE